MLSLRVCLCTLLLSVSIRGYNYSVNGWSMSGADVVTAVEGSSAVLPYTFTHPPTDLALTGSVIWYRKESNDDILLFNCTFPGAGGFACDEVTPKGGGSRIVFVGNISQRDISIMVERLSREDSDWYRCRVELNIGRIETPIPTELSVRVPGESVSVLNGTEGASAVLPCVFRRPRHYPIPYTVTWMRKDPYRHIVTFRYQGSGSWAAENGATRYELVGDPELGNATTRLKQLSAEDSHNYLCLAEFRRSVYFFSSSYTVNEPVFFLSQYETQLWIRPAPKDFPVLMLCIPLGLKTLALFVTGVAFYIDRLRTGRD
ncbi:uncharacterized protein LOC132396278 [Hypanus sabinus]|uniref:uncharacterized protein LOC132396278 n=1 Tax=Hypanus sabinus TaxID=79690 RepID=UPI0028C436EF|nr:uncharacterized protein LOC132396278 [Hypanus sabinus]